MKVGSNAIEPSRRTISIDGKIRMAVLIKLAKREHALWKVDRQAYISIDQYFSGMGTGTRTWDSRREDETLSYRGGETTRVRHSRCLKPREGVIAGNGHSTSSMIRRYCQVSAAVLDSSFNWKASSASAFHLYIMLSGLPIAIVPHPRAKFERSGCSEFVTSPTPHRRTTRLSCIRVAAMWYYSRYTSIGLRVWDRVGFAPKGSRRQGRRIR